MMRRRTRSRKRCAPGAAGAYRSDFGKGSTPGTRRQPGEFQCGVTRDSTRRPGLRGDGGFGPFAKGIFGLSKNQTRKVLQNGSGTRDILLSNPKSLGPAGALNPKISALSLAPR